MNNLNSLQILSQTTFGSGSLSGLGAVAHQVTAAGNNRVTLLQGDKPIRTIPLLVNQAPQQMTAAATATTASVPPVSLHVNLGDLLDRIGQLMPRQLRSHSLALAQDE